MTATPTAHHLRTALTDAGLVQPDVNAWLTLADQHTPERILRAATDWAWEGIPGHDGARWFLAGWEPRAAVIWWMLGFTPAQATFVSNRLTGLGMDMKQVKDWLYSSLVPDDIVLCLAAGISTVEEAVETAARFMREAPLRGSLTVQAALNGVDVRGFKASVTPTQGGQHVGPR